ncbi:MAG: GntR family transcriptional regulator [Pseudomonadota bacterium]
MSLRAPSITLQRRTTADDVFEQLRSEIVSLHLPPGTKLSEAEVAKRFMVSRQPVREAFIRLGNMQLVAIQPQRGTIVRRISRSEILQTRFIRTAVEIEVVRRACAAFRSSDEAAFVANLAKQRAALEAMDADCFNTLDYEFHRLLCATADCAFAFQTIAENKLYVDRLCMLALSSDAGKQELFDDHQMIFEHLRANNTDGAVAATRLHLSRLNETVDYAEACHPDYFDD